jgi:two-component system sensor histidine kinase and response regulator WspE
MSNSTVNIDYSMLELFVNELESHTRTLERGLLGLENNNSPQIYESLMRAAHSIKGAARIIGLDKAVELAHIMEDIFENSRKSGENVNEKTIQVLLESNDFYSSLLNFQAVEIPEILDNSTEKIKRLISELKSAEFSKPQLNGIKNHSSNPINDTVKVNELPETSNIIRTSENLKIDNALLELFKNEIFKNCNIILENCTNNDSENDLKSIADIRKAINSIKGASKIVKIQETIFICNLIEKLLDDINSGNNINDPIIPAINVIMNFPNAGDTEIINYYRNLDINKIIDLFNNDNNPDIQKNEIIDENTNEIQQIIDTVQEEISISDIPEKNIPLEKKEERFVRVLSDNLNRLLGLTGEILVQTKSLKPFSNEMQKIKTGLLELNSFKEKIYHDLFREGISDEINQKFHESSKQLDFILSTIINYIENFENFSRRLEMTSDRLYNEAVETRMKPFSEGLYGFPRLVRDVSRQLGKKAELEIKGENTKVDRDILEKLEAPLNHLVRNALDHGLETQEDRIKAGKSECGKIILEARHSSGMLLISISDDGKGINLESLKKSIVERGFATEEMASAYSPSELFDFLFLPGFSTRTEVTEISGRGVGLDVVFSMVNEVGGIIKVDSQFGKGTIFQLQLPLTLSVIRTMLVEINSEPYAIPLSRIDRVLNLNFNDIKSVENLQYIEYNGDNIGIVDAHQIFGLPKSNVQKNKYHVVILSDRLNRYGLAVDRLISQPDLVIMQLDKKLGRIQNISAGAILEDGTPVLVIDVEDAVRSIDRITKSGEIDRFAKSEDKNLKKILHILVVDDSLTVREVERKLLENKGYKVTVAVDGIDGWNTLHREKFDLIISDIDMPRMNGIEMVKRIKNDVKFREIPVMIVSYKDREDDRKKGLDAGANYYLTKSSFHDDTLLEAVYDLIGKP